MNAMSKNSKGGGGCGCGGSGGGCGCGGKTSAQCVSGDAGCTTCNDQGYTRPVFFAGQLLTEEDLQALGDYVVGKNRLHNRHLFGDGVVCGLEVTCNPCGGGKVVVQPGYALDCCGNDLTLPCPTELNISGMVRDLRRNLLGGHDCGDPCADKKKRPAESPQVNPATGAAVPAGGQQPSGQTNAGEQPNTLRHYCLYARYCEEKTDPVSPYATGDSCTFQACQPTRVREGVGFELRCRSCECGHEDILSRLCACVGDLKATEENSRNANALGAFARLNTPSERYYSTSTPTPADTSKSIKNFLMSAKSLKNTAFISRPAETERLDADTTDTQGRPVTFDTTSTSKADLEKSVLSIRDTATHLAAYYSGSEAGSLPATDKADEGEIEAARKELLSSTEVARKALATADTSTPEYAYYVSIVEGAELLATAENPGVDIGASELRAMKSGVFMSANVTQITRQRAEALREALLDALDASPRIGDCALRRDARAVIIPASDQEGKENWVVAARKLRDVFERYLMDCACLAFNPPCATCDDTSVLLACLVVDEATCEVVEICNLKRKFVISPAALRYWLPPLNWLGLLLEELCCGEPYCADEPAPTEPNDDTRPSRLNLYSQLPRDPREEARRNFVRALAELCDLDVIRSLYGGTFIRDYSSLKTQYRTSFSGSANILSGFSAFRKSAGGAETATSDATASAAAATKQPTDILAEAMKDPATREALVRAIGQELTADIQREVRASVETAASTPEFRRTVAETFKAEEVSAEVRELVERQLAAAQPAPAAPDETAIERKVEERVAAALSGEGFNTRLFEAVRSEPVTKFIGEVVGGISAEPGAGAADAAVASAIDKLKLTNVAKDLRELKRTKTENADLKKSLAALEERLANLEKRT